MGTYWVGALQAAEAAEDAARRLRERYGREAEAHVSEAERELADAPRFPRASPEDVRRALRWT
ncbi:MAG TPA: hypothetical protein VLI41_02335 [Phenylobacterium sp.]|uniref:hypothetical protein n=1 Tax=Phenylobacterium sp. TaxID=1871053 RepID=UPI002C4EC882|nr:hypothetical protein [Phenylobacterium sp.]HSV02018.1 hypothetical protein [Phenylobacterium sp.]